MTREMQVALNVPDSLLLLAGYVWCEGCGCWWWKADAEKPHNHKHQKVAA